jgi:diaminopimelate epimerase
MQGCGNDYIYFNCLDRPFPNPEKQAAVLADRHFGIGGDGIVLIQPSDRADAFMRMFNADGSEGKMCGNAIRCVAKYLYENGYVSPNLMRPAALGAEYDAVLLVDTLSGLKTLHVKANENHKVEYVTVDMGRAEFVPERIPVELPGERILKRPVTVGQQAYEITCVSMGNPHAVVFCGDVAKLNLPVIGPQFEHSPLFPESVNTEFVEVLDETHLKMRVWERGSGETLACGTGACAAVSAAAANGLCRMGEAVSVKLLGGELKITYSADSVFMTGSCERVFEGEISVDKS